MDNDDFRVLRWSLFVLELLSQGCLKSRSLYSGIPDPCSVCKGLVPVFVDTYQSTMISLCEVAPRGLYVY